MKHILITGMGRSGTTTLYKLLKEIKSIEVEHERKGDIEAYIDVYKNPDVAWVFLENRNYKKTNKDYIEVNGCLRRHTAAYSEIFPDSMIFHLVRNPKDVIRSICSRPVGPVFKRLGIKGDTVFKKACHNIADDIGLLLKYDYPVLRMELLFADYDYFKNKLIQPMGLTGRNIPEAKWVKWATNPQNTSRRIFQKYNDWSKAEKEYFKKICGQIMKELKYEV